MPPTLCLMENLFGKHTYTFTITCTKMQDDLRGYRRIIGKHWETESKNQTCRTGKSRIAMARRPDAGRTKRSPPKSERLRSFSGGENGLLFVFFAGQLIPAAIVANHDNGFQAGRGWVYSIHLRRICVVEGSDKRFRSHL